MKLRLKVVPGARSEAIEWLDRDNAVLKVRVTSPPEKGKANKAVIQALAGLLDLPVASISILTGHTGPHKTVAITDINMADLRSRVPQ